MPNGNDFKCEMRADAKALSPKFEVKRKMALNLCTSKVVGYIRERDPNVCQVAEVKAAPF